MSRSKVRAWDLIWDYLSPITQYGWTFRTQEATRDKLAEILDDLRPTLTIEQAHRVSDLIVLAHKIGKESR
jgi:hypothetical protein